MECGRLVILDTLNLEVTPLPKMAPVPRAGGKKFTRLLNTLRLNAPLFGAHHQHGRVEGLQFGDGLQLQCCYSHGALFRRITLIVHFKREQPREQIWNAT